MTIESLSYTVLTLIRNSNLDCAGVCVRIILFMVYLSEPIFYLIEVVRVSLMTDCHKLTHG